MSKQSLSQQIYDSANSRLKPSAAEVNGWGNRVVELERFITELRKENISLNRENTFLQGQIRRMLHLRTTPTGEPS